MKRICASLLTLAITVGLAVAATPSGPSWRMKADYVEACSCHLFCPCYFNKHAEHPFCEFNMAVKGREGNSSNTHLPRAKNWLTGDLGPALGTGKKRKMGGLCFDPPTTKKTRGAPASTML